MASIKNYYVWCENCEEWTNKFEVTKPSLYDIFIRIAAPERKEENHA